MSKQGIRVTFEGVQRAGNGNIQGLLRLKWVETILHQEVQLVNLSKHFDFSEEQSLFDQSFDVKAVKVTVRAKVFKKDEKQVCVTGSIDAKGEGISAHQDLDNNCSAIPN